MRANMRSQYDAAFGGKYAQALSSIPGGRKVSDPKSSASGSSNNSRVDKAPPAQPAAPNDPALSSTSNRKGKQIALDDNYGRSSDFEEALDELNSLKMSDLPDDSGPNSAEPTINPPAQNPFGRPAIAKIWGEDAVIEKSIWEPGAEYDDDVSPWPQRDERKWYGEKRAELGWQRFLPRPRSYEVEQNEIAWLINQGIKPSAAMRFYTESKENIPWELRKLKADHRLTEAEEQRMLDDYSRWQQRVKAETAEAQAGRKKRGYRKEGKAVPVENIARAEEQMENTEEKEEEDDALPVHVLPEIGLVVDEQALRNIAPIWNLLLDAISA